MPDSASDKMLEILSLILFLTLTCTYASRQGHLKPLGQQRKSEGHIEVIKDMPHAKTFHYKYSFSNKPVIIKAAAAHIPGFFQWNDNYMRRKFGHILVDVLEKKKDESTNTRKYIFKDFLKNYKKEGLEITMCHPVRDELLQDMRLLPFLLCGGYLNVLQEAQLWLTGKNTKTLLQQSPYDNVMCLFSGTKRLFLVDSNNSSHIKRDGPIDKFPSSLLDVDAVDLDKYPGMSKAPWWEANVEAGDCIYIPANWWHQSYSRISEEEGRHMEFNLMFYHLDHINMTECDHTHMNTVESLISFDGINLNDENEEALRFMVKMEVYNKPTITRQELFKDVLRDIANTPSKYTDYKVITSPKKDITVDELYQLTTGEIFLLRKYYSGLLRKQDVMKKMNQFIYERVKNVHDEL